MLSQSQDKQHHPSKSWDVWVEVSTNLSAELLNKRSQRSAWQSSGEVLNWIRFGVPASFFSSSSLEATDSDP